jgi:DNA-binding XRE family transcriptional regulator
MRELPVAIYPLTMISGKQIRAARALLGWKQRELAAAAALSEVSIKNAERGVVDSRPCGVLPTLWRGNRDRKSDGHRSWGRPRAFRACPYRVIGAASYHRRNGGCLRRSIAGAVASSPMSSSHERRALAGTTYASKSDAYAKG